MDNIKPFKQKTFTVYQIKIHFFNEESEIHDCTFYGAMETVPGFIGFSNTAPDEMEEMPFMIIRDDAIKKIEILGTKEKVKK